MAPVYAVVVALILVGLVALVWSAATAPRKGIATPMDGVTQFRNHQAMARWIDRQLSDEMASASIPADQRKAGRTLLAEFYGDEPGRELR